MVLLLEQGWLCFENTHEKYKHLQTFGTRIHFSTKSLWHLLLEKKTFGPTILVMKVEISIKPSWKVKESKPKTISWLANT
jgi:hypothetical protein